MILKLFFCVAVCFHLVQATPQPTAQSNAKQFSFEDIYSSTFYKRGFSVKWRSTGTNTKDVYTYKKDGGIVSVDPTTPDVENPLFTKEDLKDSVFSEVNSAMDHVLLGFEWKQKWRHSFSAKYKVKKTGEAAVDLNVGPLNFAGWSPAGDKISFVKDNNLYVTNSFDVQKNVIKLTDDGSTVEPFVYNGIPDWLYEEEIVSGRVSHYWSPDGSKVCYSKIKDNKGGVQHWLVYGNKTNVKEELKTIPYPKAGLVNAPTSKVTLHVAHSLVYDPAAYETANLLVPTELKDKDHYFLQVKWISNDKVFVTWSNRIQTIAYHVYYDLSKIDANGDTIAIEIYEEQIEKGWIQIKPVSPLFPKGDEKSLITIKAHKPANSEITWRHLVRFTESGATYKEEFLMDGPYEVTSILRLTEKFLYFLRTGANARERKIYRINLINNKIEEVKVPKMCSYVGASFSHSGLYYIRSCDGPELPSHTLVGTEGGFKDKVYEDNSVLKEALKKKDTVSNREFINKDGVYIELYMPQVKKAEKVPLLVYTYAGPGTQEVSERYDWGSRTKNWLLHMASAYGVAIASIDGRGTVGNGEEFKLAMYKKMGDVEIADQIKGIKVLAKRSDIDEKKVAIFGWSYGGFTSANVLADSADVKCALSVAPVTYKGLYDTAYSERFLGLFKDSRDAYNKTNLQFKAEKFKNKKFLVAHGTADDNVHYTNFAQLIKELEMHQILFTQLTYPDQNHGIRELSMNQHLFRSMTNFLTEECFDYDETKSSASVTASGIAKLFLPIVAFLATYFM